MNNADALEEAILPSEAPPDEPVKVLAVVDGYGSLHAALRSRREELNISCETVDRAARLTRAHASKLLAPQPLKKAGWETLSFLLPALGARLILAEDPQALAQLKKFSTRVVKTPARSVPWGRSGKQTVVSMRFVKRIARNGGEARARVLSPARKRAIARKAAKARWRKPKLVDITKRSSRPQGPVVT
jgi:hypothetical protein